METAPSNAPRYRVGPLSYSGLPQLLTACALILLGVFAYGFCMAFIPKIIPLRLKDLGCSNTLLVFIMSTMGQILNMTVCPWVSFQSDRFRSPRWGRRFPFIYYTMPMMCAAWLLFAFLDSEASLLCRLVSRWWQVSPATMTILLIAAIMVFYQFFLMFVGSVIYYVYNDVIPAQFMTRFMGAVQVTSSLAVAAFNFFIFRHAIEHFRAILIGISIFYAFAMAAMCLLVREPQLPPPSSDEKRQSKGLRGILTFARESFCHPFYWHAAISNAALAIGGTISVFTVFRYQEMGFSLKEIGDFHGWTELIATAFVFLIALVGTPLIDRWHPVRVSVFTLLFAILTPLLECQWIFFTPPTRVIFWGSLLISASFLHIRLRGVASMPTLSRIYPKSRFGQFCSASAMFRSLTVLVGALLCGACFDLLKKGCGLGDYAYRFIYVWQFAFYIIANIFYLLMYRQFLRLGGYTGYKAPAPWSPDKFEDMPVTPCEPPSRRWIRIAARSFDAVFGFMLLWAIVAFFRARAIGAPANARAFLVWCIPANALLLAAYYAVRRFMTDPGRPAPHHGILLVTALTAILLIVAFCVQNWLAVIPGETTTAAGLWLYETAFFAVMVLLLFLYTVIERRSQTIPATSK